MPTNRALNASSMAEAFRITAEDHADRVAVRTKDDSVSFTWGELRERVDALAGGLAKLGVQRGDTVALMFSNRPEFSIADLAVISLSLGVINLFPFLPLDGGHIFWALAEKIRGKAIPFSVLERAGFVGFALVMMLFAIGLSNDIGRLTGEGFQVR